MQREPAILPSLPREKARQFSNHRHIGVILAHLAQLIVDASERNPPSLSLCQEKHNEGLKLAIELPQPSDRRGDLLCGNGLACSKMSGDVDELVVARLEENAIESAFIDKLFDQRNLEGLCVTISVRSTFSQHDDLSVARVVCHGRKRIRIAGLDRDGGPGGKSKRDTQKNREYGLD